MNSFTKKVVFLAALVTFVGLAVTAQAQNAGISVQIPGTSTAWFNSYADDAMRRTPPKHYGSKGHGVAHPPKHHDQSFGKPGKDRPELLVKRPHHKGYYGQVKPRRHVYATKPRRNVRGYANAPWNR